MHISCPHYPDCGGCAHQDIYYNEELLIKEEHVCGLLSPFLNAETGRAVWEGIMPAPSREAYRNKMEFAFGDEGRGSGLALGIRKRRSFYEVVTPEDCQIIPQDFKTILLTVLMYFRQTGESFHHRRRHTGALRHLVLRRGEFTGELLINLVTTSGLTAPLRPLIELLLELRRSGKLSGTVAGILHTVNDGLADTVNGEDTRVLYGRDYFYERVCGLVFKVSAFAFFQTNSAGAERLYNLVSEYAGRCECLYDLYCGTGTIAQVLSDSARAVTGVEINKEAVRAAVENAALNDIHNCAFYAGDVLNAAIEEKAPDVVIVDPPRDGLHPKALQKIINMRAERLVYVSCKPSSLARDAAILTENGYRVKRVACVDMFPRTAHVETVCLLTRDKE